MTQRIGEVVVDGVNIKAIKKVGNEWENGTYRFDLNVDGIKTGVNDWINPSTIMKNDKLIMKRFSSKEVLDENCLFLWNNVAVIYIHDDKATTLKYANDYLQKNPITIQYQLETESVKTVDLTIQDQDDQPTQLKTFNDVTHIETQADSVLPTVILEYGTKNEEVLAALPQDHEEVADAQAALSDAIDSQSDEVETTMMALTEVYEGRNKE